MTSAARRQFLLMFTALPLVAFPACRGAQAAEPLPAPALRRRGDAGDTPAIARALATGQPVHLPAGGGSGPGGVYLVDMLDLPEGATISGDGATTVVRSTGPRVPNVFRVDGSRVTTRGITLRDMVIEGHVLNGGFVEHHNLVNLSGVSDCLIENVTFRGFAGDGLYLGAEREGIERVPRQNARVTVRGCVFDGVNNDNRNGISVTGGSDIVIDRCRFVRCTRPDMPGPVDFEADGFAFYMFERISVTNCVFEGCGGNVGQVSLITPEQVRRLPRGVTISGNRFSRYRGSGSDVAIIVHRRPVASMPSMEVVIENNTGNDGRAGVRLYSGKGIIVRNNRWQRYLGQSFIGYTGHTDGCLDIQISDYFEECGTIDGAALGIYNAGAVTISASRFTRCGNEKPGASCILLAPGRSDGIVLADNDFLGNAPGVIPVRRNPEHVLARRPDVRSGNLSRSGRVLDH